MVLEEKKEDAEAYPMVEWDISTALPEKPEDDGESSVNLELLVKEQAEADTVKNGRIRKEVIVADASGERSSLILWDGHAKASLENDQKIIFVGVRVTAWKGQLPMNCWPDSSLLYPSEQSV